MNDEVYDLDFRNEKAMQIADRNGLGPVPDGEFCDICGVEGFGSSGFVQGTETENLWGDPCPRGCPRARWLVS